MVADFLIIGTGGGTVRALEASDGTQRWRYEAGHPFGGSALALAGGVIVAAALDGYVCALDARGGAVRWQRTLPGVTQAVGEHGLRLAASETCIAVQYGKRILALDPKDGASLWNYAPARESRSVWLAAVGAVQVYIVEQQVIRPPVPADGSPEEVFLAQHRGVPATWIASALSARDGARQWVTAEHGAVEPPWDGGSSLAEADGVVYACGHGLHALSAATGQLRWTQGAVPEFHVASLGVGHGYLAVALGRYLGAFRADTGVPLWSDSGLRSASGYFEEFASVQMSDDDGAIVAARMAFNPQGVRIEAREPETGGLRWTWPIEHIQPRTSWRIRGAGGMLYVPVDGAVHGLRTSDGRELWQTELGGMTFALLAGSEAGA